MNYASETPTEYNILGFIQLGIIIAAIVYFSVRHIRKSKQIYKAREERNKGRRDSE